MFDHDYNYTQGKGLKVDNGVFILAISACLPTIAEHVIAMAVIELLANHVYETWRVLRIYIWE